MSRTIRISTALIAAAALFAGGCDEEKPKSSAPSAQSAAAPPPSAPAPAPSAAPTPPPTASASAPVHDCPKGSSGDATLAKPCEAKGKERMMEVTWTKKITDEGPQFRVVNKSPATILYGKVVVFFYDKAGKLLESKESTGKGHTSHSCAGNKLFAGVMKPAEKAVLTFSCVKKDNVPEGTDTIEAEIQMVGFADASGTKSEYYWRNNDLTPDTRPKGGVK